MDVSLNTLTIAAFRYALGRSTYIVEDVVNDIIKNIDIIDSTYLRRMKQEIIEASYNNNIGMNMDKKLWFKLIENIDKKLLD